MKGCPNVVEELREDSFIESLVQDVAADTVTRITIDKLPSLQQFRVEFLVAANSYCIPDVLWEKTVCRYSATFSYAVNLQCTPESLHRFQKNVQVSAFFGTIRNVNKTNPVVFSNSQIVGMFF